LSAPFRKESITGKIQELRLGEGIAHVIVRVGKNIVESVVTRTSAEEQKVKKGDAVTVVSNRQK
jgi:molybdopterin-binding protein